MTTRKHLSRAAQLDMPALWQALARHRDRTGKTFLQLADEAGINSPTFTRIKLAATIDRLPKETDVAYRRRRNYRPDAETLLSLCWIADIDPRTVGSYPRQENGGGQ